MLSVLVQTTAVSLTFVCGVSACITVARLAEEHSNFCGGDSFNKERTTTTKACQRYSIASYTSLQVCTLSVLSSTLKMFVGCLSMSVQSACMLCIVAMETAQTLTLLHLPNSLASTTFLH